MGTHDRQRHFGDAPTVALVIDQFLHTARLEGFEMLAYCFMPDHVHLLIEGLAEQADVRRFARLGKQRAGYLFTRQRHERLWQDSFFDRTLRPEDDIAALIAYVVNNPVRAGLVSDPSEYLFWGSQRYSRPELLGFIHDSRRV